MNKFNVLLLFIGNCCGCKISVNGYIGNANLLEFYRFYIVFEVCADGICYMNRKRCGYNIHKIGCSIRIPYNFFVYNFHRQFSYKIYKMSVMNQKWLAVSLWKNIFIHEIRHTITNSHICATIQFTLYCSVLYSIYKR